MANKRVKLQNTDYSNIRKKIENIHSLLNSAYDKNSKPINELALLENCLSLLEKSSEKYCKHCNFEDLLNKTELESRSTVKDFKGLQDSDDYSKRIKRAKMFCNINESYKNSIDNLTSFIRNDMDILKEKYRTMGRSLKLLQDIQDKRN